MTGSQKFLAGFMLFIITIALLFAGYVWAALHWSYSDGERAGTMQKFSYKGWLCKTWEGELLLTTVPGAIPEKFEFTVRDEIVARQLMEAAGKRVIQLVTTIPQLGRALILELAT